jgi:hypothetical protein
MVYKISDRIAEAVRCNRRTAVATDETLRSRFSYVFTVYQTAVVAKLKD